MNNNDFDKTMQFNLNKDNDMKPREIIEYVYNYRIYSFRRPDIYNKSQQCEKHRYKNGKRRVIGSDVKRVFET